MHRIVSLILVTLAGVLGTTLLPDTSHAQYFGRNKVQYEDFDFQVLETAHFEIFHYEEERAAVEYAAPMAERWYTRLSRLLNHEFRGRQPLILYASHPHFRQTNVIPGLIGEGTGGVTEPFRRRIVMPFAGPLAETDHVLGHELVHAFQFDMLGRRLGALPLWVVEGMAEYFSVGPLDSHTAMWVRDALARDRLPTVRQLSDPRYFPYRFGHAFWSYIGGTYGDTAVARILKRAGFFGGPRQALQEVTGQPTDSLSRAWHQAIEQAYGPLRETTRPPEEFGRVLLSKKNAGEINLGPVLSPDGESILFLSERSQFAIELYLADAQTGEIRRKITEAALDPHFESLQFINSAGAWAPDGQRFVFAAVSGGQPILRIVNAESGKKERELKFPSLGEIFNPAWSPDGRYIAFSAIEGGLSDLYLYDLQADELARLTDDPYADLQPAWSPDGERLAFVTDRFTADLASLSFENYRIGLIRPDSREIRAAPGFSRGKHTNPQWSPDGSSLYFISDLNGIPNIYRADLEAGEFFQITNLFTGVSGITSLSPAISVASGSGELAFSVYQDGGYTVYRTDSRDVLAGGAARAADGRVNPALLPPVDRTDSEILAYLRRPELGLPDERAWATRDYGPGLGLDRAAGASVVAGTDRFGAFVGGGTALVFSDMLNQHQLATLFQVNGSFEDAVAAVSYQNQANRLVWGGAAQRLPLTFGGFLVKDSTVAGEPVFLQRRVIFRQTTYRATGNAWYPFNQAQRLEFNASFSNTSFEEEVRTLAVSQSTGALLLDQERERTPFDDINLVSGSSALVFDNSIFGATSPILGQRYRFEATPTTGTLTFVEALGDFRRYFMPVRPFTLAFRALHFGRYGADADDDRLHDIFLGFSGLVRGYQSETFDFDECQGATATDGCPVFNQLFGSRIAVLNAELRFPLFGVLGIGEGYYGFFPVELALFGDAGVAWRDDLAATATDEEAFFLGGDRDPVFSAGATLRTNLFGYLVVQLDFARAFERDKWVTQFSFLPGW